jgi:hypothetical protein
VIARGRVKMLAMADRGVHVTIEGTEYIVAETHDDGSLLLRPDTTSAAFLQGIGARLATKAEFDALTGEMLPPDYQG